MADTERGEEMSKSGSYLGGHTLLRFERETAEEYAKRARREQDAFDRERERERRIIAQRIAEGDNKALHRGKNDPRRRKLGKTIRLALESVAHLSDAEAARELNHRNVSDPHARYWYEADIPGLVSRKRVDETD